jgi:hypothetical protein
MTTPIVRSERRHRFNGRTLILTLSLAWTVFFALLIYRAYTVSTTDERLCNVIRGLIVVGGRPPANAPAYFREHPEELPKARRAYDHALNKLDCRHLPTS